MNERIKQLAEQAGAEQVATDPNGEFVKYITPEMQKFAELIVRECAHIAWLYDEPKLSGHGAIIANSIKKQFGVEE